MQIPQNEKISLGLLQGYLIFQIYLNSTKSFTIQISISNNMNSKRRLLFSACSKEFVINNYHCRIPLIDFPINTWVNLSINIISFVNFCFSNENFRSIDFICLSADCKVRKICAMRKNFTDSLNDYFQNDDSSIPKNFLLPSNINFINLNVDINYIQNYIQVNNIKESYLNNNVHLPLSSQGQRALSLNNNNNNNNNNNSNNNNNNMNMNGNNNNNNMNGLKNNFRMPNTASEKNRYIGQNLGKNIMNSFGVKSKSLGKVYKIVNGKNDKNDENNNLYEHKLQSANVNKVNLIENAFQGNDYYPIRKLSDNHDKNNNLIVKNLNSVNKSKNWNLYDQNGRRIKNNINLDLNNNINNNNNNFSKTPNAKVILQAGINTMVNIKNIDYNNQNNKKPLYQSSLYENNYKNKKDENSKDLFNFNDIKFNDYNFNNNHLNNEINNINSQKKFIENSPIKEERSRELIKEEDNNKLLGIFNYKDLDISSIGVNQTLLNNNASIQEIVDFDNNNNNNTLLGNNIINEDIIYKDKNVNINNNINFHIEEIIDKKIEKNEIDNYKNIIDDNINNDNILQNLSLASNRPYTPPVSKIIPENSKNNNIINVINGDKINESIIQNHYNELVYDKNLGKYFNANTHIYYDFK